MSWLDDPQLQGPILGIIASINLVTELLIDSGAIEQEKAINLFSEKMAAMRENASPQMIEASHVLDQTLRFLTSPERAAVRALLKSPPAGSS